MNRRDGLWLDRRTWLALMAGATAALAGCGSDDGDPADASATDRDESALEDETDDADSGDETDTDDVDADDADTDDSDDADADESTIDLAIGDSLAVGDLELVVEDAAWGTGALRDATHDRLEAADDDTFAVVDLAVTYDADGRDETGSATVLAVDEQIEIALVDGERGTVDRLSVSDDAGLDLAASRLAPGELARGELVYELEGEPDERDGELNGPVLEVESLADGETTAIDLETTSDSPVTLEQGLADDALGFADSVEIGGVTLTVATLEQGNNLGGFMQSDDGHEIVAVGLTVDNESGRDRTLSATQAQLTDETGWRHAAAPGVLRALEGVDDTVPDGEDHEGKIAYQIDDGLEELYWVFDGDDWGEDRRVCWQLR